MTDVLQGDDGNRAHIVLSPLATAQARVMAGRLRITVPELVRRGLGIMHLWISLPDGDELYIRRKDGRLDRIKLDTGEAT